MGTIALALVLFICVVVPISDAGGYRSYVGYMAFLAGLVWLVTAIMSARIVTIGDQLMVVNVFTVVTLRPTDVRSVDGTNGVVIRTSWGQDVESLAYGRSVLQMVLPSKRFALVAERVESWRSASASSAMNGADAAWQTRRMSARRGRGRHSQPVPRIHSARHHLTRGLPLLIAATQMLGIVLWRLEDVLRPIVIGGF